MKAKWHGEPYWDYKDKKYLITFETEQRPEVFNSTRDKELTISIGEYKNIRSLRANRYFWELVNKIAVATGLSDSDVHDQFLVDNLSFVYKDGAVEWRVDDSEPNKYGLIYVDENYYLYRGEKVTLSKADGDFYRTKDGSPKTSNIYYHIKGSHQMNTKEMARLIDGVVSEAKDLGIETLPPDELERMKQAWNQS